MTVLVFVVVMAEEKTKWTRQREGLNLEFFGHRLRDARLESRLDQKMLLSILNNGLLKSGLPLVHIDTYRSWEYIGTPKEKPKGKAYPHPSAYEILAGALQVTTYWLFLGSVGGRIERYRKNLGDRVLGVVVEQRRAVRAEDRKLSAFMDDMREFASKISVAERTAMHEFIKVRLSELKK